MTHMFALCDSLNLLGSSSVLFPFPPPSHLPARTGFSGTCCLCTCARASRTNGVEMNWQFLLWQRLALTEQAQCGTWVLWKRCRAVLDSHPVTHSVNCSYCYHFRLQGSEFSLLRTAALPLYESQTGQETLICGFPPTLWSLNSLCAFAACLLPESPEIPVWHIVSRKTLEYVWMLAEKETVGLV